MESYNQLYDKGEYLFARDMCFGWKGTGKDLKEANAKKKYFGIVVMVG